MKKLLYTFLAVSIIFTASGQDQGYDSQGRVLGSKLIAKQLNSSSKTEHIMYFKNKPFTGIAYDEKERDGGRIKLEMEYVDGKSINLTFEWVNENDILFMQGDGIDSSGYWIGYKKECWKNGRVKQEGEWKVRSGNYLFDGIEYFWHINGKIMAELRYTNTNVVSKKRWDKEGQEIEWRDIDLKDMSDSEDSELD